MIQSAEDTSSEHGSSSSSTASLFTEGTSSGYSSSVSSSASVPSLTPAFPANVAAALLQQLHQGKLPASPQIPPAPAFPATGALAQSNSLLQQALADEIRRAELLKSQLALLDHMALAQGIANQQKSSFLASSGLGLTPAVQQAAAINALLLSSSLMAQALTPRQAAGSLCGGQQAPLQAATFAALAPHLVSALNPLGANPLVHPSPVNNIVASQTTPQVITAETSAKIGYSDASLIPDPTDSGSTSRAEPFPAKVHRMLSELEQQEGGTDIASFLPHGRAFIIHKPKKFTEEIMPKYFRMSRFSSFQRQLNLYDFQRITEGKDKGAYYHELFLYGRPALTMKMKRTKIKGSAPWNVGHHPQDIDFYKMPPVQRNNVQRIKGGPKQEGIAISG